MRNGYYCYTATTAEESLLEFRSELVGKGVNPDQADEMMEAVRQYHQSAAVVNLKMFVDSNIKTT